MRVSDRISKKNLKEEPLAYKLEVASWKGIWTKSFGSKPVGQVYQGFNSRHFSLGGRVLRDGESQGAC